MTRVAVIGNAGGGKSTLFWALSSASGLPYFSVDKVQWKPGWEPASEREFRAAHDEILSGETWIIDGFGPWEAVEQRFRAADTIIFVDFPLWRHMWWATKRQVRSVIWGRPDGPEGCPMWRVTFRLYRMMWRMHTELRPRLMETIDSYRESKAVFHIRSLPELAAFRLAHC